MKKMKKTVALCLAITMSMSLTACKGSASETPVSGEQGQESTDGTDKELASAVKSVLEDKKEVNISFWTGTGTENFPYLEEMVNHFMEEYPNIKVDFSNQGALAELTDKLTQNIVSSTTPTISSISPTTFPEYINAGAIVDMAQFYNDGTIGYSEEERGDFYQNYLDEAESLGGEGTLYGFPTNKKTSNILVYNKSYFDAQGWDAPKTYDDVVEYSKAIFEDTGMPGFSYDTSYGDDAFKSLSQQYGSTFIAEDGTIDIDNEGSRQAVNFYKENMDAGYFTVPVLMPSAGGGSYSNKGFLNEECYMFVGAAAGIQYAIPGEDAQKKFEVGTAPVPQIKDGKAVYYSKGEDYCMFANASLEEQGAGWLLIKYLSEPENNTTWYIKSGNLPVRRSMLEQPEYKEWLESKEGDASYYKAQAVNAVLQIQDQMTFERVIPNSSKLSEACGTMWMSVMVGGADAETALSEAVAAVQ